MSNFEISGRAGVLLLVLSPLAYLGSVYLETLQPTVAGPVSIDRDSAIHLASQFAASRLLPIKGWTPTVATVTDGDLARVLLKQRPPAVTRIVTPTIGRVTFNEPGGRRYMDIDLSPEGRVLGFHYKDPGDTSPAMDETAARLRAEDQLYEWLGKDTPLQLGTVQSSLVDKGHTRRFTWEAAVPGLKTGNARFVVEIGGGLVTSYTASIKFPSGYVDSLRPYALLRNGFSIASAVYILLAVIYAIVRFFRRKADNEISLRRTFAVTFCYAGFTLFYVLSGGIQNVLRVSSEGNVPLPPAFFYATFAVTFSVMGLFLGLSYGAGEGDVRAAYPGKLTSLDALFSGKIFSRNVARSILLGGGFAGFLLLLTNAFMLLIGSPRPDAQNGALSQLFLPYPMGALFTEKILDSATVATFALLLPLSMWTPRIHRPALFYTLLLLSAALGGSAWLIGGSTIFENIATLIIGVAAVYIPFLYADFLTAISSVFMMQFAALLIHRGLAAVALRHAAMNVVAGGIVFLLIELYCAWRGRDYDDKEVRPAYARNIAEHMALQAELGAARQAQLRLLPDAPPTITGLSIAGSCVPAREVGGDFFDFYTLDDHRLAVFVAEGGNRGLGSAMTIALAKGFLLYASRLDLPPAEVLRSLQETLGSVLQDAGSSMSLLFAVIDARSGVLRFARAGESPQLLINGKGVAEEVAPAAALVAIRHGVVTLDPGDAVLFYTDGVAAQLNENVRQNVLSAVRGANAADLHSAFFRAVLKRKNDHPADDVTAVIIRRETPEARAVEGVA